MERTGEYIFSTTFFLTYTNTSMTTGIQKCAKVTLIVSRGKYRRTKIIDRQKATGSGNSPDKPIN